MAHHSSGGDQASRARGGDQGGEQAPGSAELGRLLEELRAQATKLTAEGGRSDLKDDGTGLQADIWMVRTTDQLEVITTTTAAGTSTERRVIFYQDGTADVVLREEHGSVTTEARVACASDRPPVGTITSRDTDPQDTGLKEQMRVDTLTPRTAIEVGEMIITSVQSQLNQMSDQGQATQTQ